MPAVRWDGPTRTIDTEARWQQARWQLHDTTLDLQDRIAGLLLLLYAQTAATVSRLALDRIHIADDETRGLRRPHDGHVGEHGNLEWLPGKAVGMSASCGPMPPSATSGAT